MVFIDKAVPAEFCISKYRPSTFEQFHIFYYEIHEYYIEVEVDFFVFL